jgi:hypothetical protein
MADLNHYDPIERENEKARARVADEVALLSGEISREQLRLRNGFLAPLEVMSSVIKRQGVIA